MAQGSSLIDQINQAMQAPIIEIHTRLLGYEAAIAVLIQALDRAGALPIAAARSALDAAADALERQGDPNRPAAAAIRQLSRRLQPAPRRTHH